MNIIISNDVAPSHYLVMEPSLVLRGSYFFFFQLELRLLLEGLKIGVYFIYPILGCGLDDVLKVNFSLQLTNDVFYPPNHKTHFSFALGCPQGFNFSWPFWCGWVETGLNGQKWMGKGKFCMHPRAKIIHVLWLGDLKDSLKNVAAKSIHNKPSNVGRVLSSFFWKKKIKFCSQITFLKLFSKWKIEFVKWLIQFLRKITPNPKTNKKWLRVFWWFATLQPSVSQWIWQTRKFWPVFSSTPVEIKNK